MKSKSESNKNIYTIDYDETVIFKERITRFTVNFDFKEKSENSKSENLAHLRNSS